MVSHRSRPRKDPGSFCNFLIVWTIRADCAWIPLAPKLKTAVKRKAREKTFHGLLLPIVFIVISLIQIRITYTNQTATVLHTPQPLCSVEIAATISELQIFRS